jgi:transcriptional regulator with XRE-family HTH domain
MLQQQLGLRLAALRKVRELTQVQLAKSLGCSVEFVSLVERGVNAPSVAGLEKYARVLRVDVADLFRFKTAKPRRQTPSRNRT